MLSIQEISDRLEIQDLITNYCTVVDKKNWKDYREIFLEDASIDYSGSGGLSGTVDEVIEYLDMSLGFQKELGFAPTTQHLVSNFELTLNENAARVRCMLYNPIMLGQGEGASAAIFGVWYTFEVERNEVWKIKSLSQEPAIKITGLKDTGSLF